jgi:DNA-directed RNA polymerase specialized sigma24 family protein
MDPDQLRHQEFELQALPHGNSLLRAAIRLTGDRSLAEDMGARNAVAGVAFLSPV